MPDCPRFCVPIAEYDPAIHELIGTYQTQSECLAACNCNSSSANSSNSCHFIECGGSGAFADCGLTGKVVDCDTCECVDSSSSSGQSSSSLSSSSSSGGAGCALVVLKASTNIQSEGYQDANWGNVVYGNGVFLAQDTFSGDVPIIKSTDGVNWTSTGITGGVFWERGRNLVFQNNAFLHLVSEQYNEGINSIALTLGTSNDGVFWSEMVLASTSIPGGSYDVFTGNGKYYLSLIDDNARDAQFAVSSDSLSWSFKAPLSATLLTEQTRFLGINATGGFAGVIPGTLSQLVIPANNKLVAFGTGVSDSAPQLLWNYVTASTAPLSAPWPAELDNGNNTWLFWGLFSGVGKLFRQSAGFSPTAPTTLQYLTGSATWTTITLPTALSTVTNTIRPIFPTNVHEVNGTLVARNGENFQQVWTSEDGLNWTFAGDADDPQYLSKIEFNGQKLYAILNPTLSTVQQPYARLYTSENNGLTWTETGNTENLALSNTRKGLGAWQPQFAAGGSRNYVWHGSTVLFATVDDSNQYAMAKSINDGANWTITQLTNLPTDFQGFFRLEYAASKYVGIYLKKQAGTNNYTYGMAYSTDGLAWTATTLDLGPYTVGNPTTYESFNLKFLNNQFVLLARGDNGPSMVATSADGVTWNKQPVNALRPVFSQHLTNTGPVFANGVYVFDAQVPAATYSATLAGVLSTVRSALVTTTDISTGDGGTVPAPVIAQSADDGATWTVAAITGVDFVSNSRPIRTLLPSGWGNISDTMVTYGNNKFVAFFYDATTSRYTVAYSTDGITWVKVIGDPLGHDADVITDGRFSGKPHTRYIWNRLKHLNGRFIAVAQEEYYGNDGGTGAIACSPDGINWTVIKDITDTLPLDITYGANKFVVSGRSGGNRVGVSDFLVLTSPA